MSLGSPQTFNRYSYAGNMPSIATDASGGAWCDETTCESNSTEGNGGGFGFRPRDFSEAFKNGAENYEHPGYWLDIYEGEIITKDYTEIDDVTGEVVKYSTEVVDPFLAGKQWIDGDGLIAPELGFSIGPERHFTDSGLTLLQRVNVFAQEMEGSPMAVGAFGFPEAGNGALIESMMAHGRTVVIAEEGSDAMNYLDHMGAEAAAGGEAGDNMHILVRPNASKATLLEEFLHGTQNKLGLMKRYSGPELEEMLKNFMQRHARMLGLHQEF